MEKLHSASFYSTILTCVLCNYNLLGFCVYYTAAAAHGRIAGAVSIGPRVKDELDNYDDYYCLWWRHPLQGVWKSRNQG